MYTLPTCIWPHNPTRQLSHVGHGYTHVAIPWTTLLATTRAAATLLMLCTCIGEISSQAAVAPSPDPVPLSAPHQDSKPGSQLRSRWCRDATAPRKRSPRQPLLPLTRVILRRTLSGRHPERRPEVATADAGTVGDAAAAASSRAHAGAVPPTATPEMPDGVPVIGDTEVNVECSPAGSVVIFSHPRASPLGNRLARSSAETIQEDDQLILQQHQLALEGCDTREQAESKRWKHGRVRLQPGGAVPRGAVADTAAATGHGRTQGWQSRADLSLEAGEGLEDAGRGVSVATQATVVVGASVRQKTAVRSLCNSAHALVWRTALVHDRAAACASPACHEDDIVAPCATSVSAFCLVLYNIHGIS